MSTSKSHLLRDLLLGTEPRQRLRITRSLTAASVYLVCVALQGYACIAGFMHWRSAIELSALIVLNVLFWYGVLRSGINERFKDPALTLPQIMSALTVIAGAYAITGPVHGATMLLLALVLVFGIFNMKARDAQMAGGYTVLVMALTIIYKGITEPEHYPVKLEIAHFVLIAAIIPTISSLAAQLSNMRAKLQAQKEELSQAVQRIQILATRDDLTGLYNRRHMMDVLTQHQKRLRETDVLARWGGEEFLVLLNDTQAAQANIGLERLRELLDKTLLVPNLPELKPTFSSGLTAYELSEPLHTCIERADQALYRAKASGRNRTETACLPEVAAPREASVPSH
jgi:GGDEF domain-containing protein